jgi:hypothetical protein
MPTRQTNRRIAIAAALTTFAALGACGSKYTSGVMLSPGGATEVSILGNSPYVELYNDGPGAASVEFDLAGMGHTERRELASGAMIGRGVSKGPINITMRAPDEFASIRIEARRANGLSLRAITPPAKANTEGSTP